MLWNADLKVDDLLEEFYTMYFGPAAGPMRQYWTRAEELWCNMDVKKRGVVDGLNQVLYTPEALMEMKGYLDAALALAPEGSDYAARVQAVQKEFFPYLNTIVNAKKTLPVLNVQAASSAPAIDGVEDEIWRNVPKITLLNNQDGVEPTVQTEARILCDKENLYLFIDCLEPRMSNLKADCTVDDAKEGDVIWFDDSVELFISPDSRVAGKTVQIALNPNGAIWDACYNYTGYPGEKGIEYSSGAIRKAVRQADRWTLEVAIPLRNLVIDGIIPTQEWRFNLCRNRWASGIDNRYREATSWSPTLTQAWNLPQRFGYLKFN